jgi:LacI family transcriptional regulator
LAVDTVVSDNLAASRAAVTQLLGRGHLRVGTILSDLSIPTGRARFDGYRQALADAGVAFDPSLAVFGKPVEAEGYRLAGELFALSTPPTALFTGSKLLSLGALRYLFDHRIEVPGDVALAVFDALDWLPNAPEILSVAQPALEIGARAAELLLRRMDEPRRPVERLVLPSAVTWGSS